MLHAHDIAYAFSPLDFFNDLYRAQTLVKGVHGFLSYYILRRICLLPFQSVQNASSCILSYSNAITTALSAIQAIQR
jgi:hypothetical protein